MMLGELDASNGSRMWSMLRCLGSRMRLDKRNTKRIDDEVERGFEFKIDGEKMIPSYIRKQDRYLNQLVWMVHQTMMVFRLTYHLYTNL